MREIEQMKRSVGKCMYRGLLKKVARVWNPKDIRDPAIQQKVLAHMQAAETRFPAAGCGARESRAEPVDPNTWLSEVAVHRSGG